MIRVLDICCMGANQKVGWRSGGKQKKAAQIARAAFF